MDDHQTARRTSNAHDRPTRTPFGPRIRTKRADLPTQDQPDSPTNPTPTPTARADAAVQATEPRKSAPPSFFAPTPLTLPPTISFESTPIPWKGLPLEAAQWTFSSTELQDMVSKAIRLSARDSFVRLLSQQALEVDIVQEAARLDAARLAAQAKWRFEVAKRTMLMQALNAAAAFSAPTGEANPVPAFVAQLANVIASCDSILASVLHMADQQSQIAVIQHQHSASALGMALRKLNKAHERQGHDLKRALARVHTLEDELEEAWREAEKMAVEFDDLEHEIADSSSDRASDVLPDEHFDETAADIPSDNIAVVLGVTATAVASKATLVTSPPSPTLFFDQSDTKSVLSIKSTRSRRSVRDVPSHVARIQSARRRSRTASNASLRLPKALRFPTNSPTDAPPVPALPLASVPGQSFLDMDAITPELARKPLPPRFPEPTVALPTPPHSAGPLETHVPTIRVEGDEGKSTRLNGLDRMHSLQIFSSLSPRKTRRSKLVMSLTGSDRSSDLSPSPVDGSWQYSESPSPSAETGAAVCMGTNAMGGGIDVTIGARTSASTASPTSNHSPVSLPAHALAHTRGPSSPASPSPSSARPGSANARLSTPSGEVGVSVPVGSPRRSLVSRASSVILRRLSQATMGGRSGAGGGGTGTGKGSPSKARSRLSGGHALERWSERLKEEECKEESDEVPESSGGGGDEGAGGEVMLIGSLRPSMDAP